MIESYRLIRIICMSLYVTLCLRKHGTNVYCLINSGALNFLKSIKISLVLLLNMLYKCLTFYLFVRNNIHRAIKVSLSYKNVLPKQILEQN